MRLALSFMDYEFIETGRLVEFASVFAIRKIGNKLRVQPAQSTMAHVFDLQKIADVRLTVHEDER